MLWTMSMVGLFSATDASQWADLRKKLPPPRLIDILTPSTVEMAQEDDEDQEQRLINEGKPATAMYNLSYSPADNAHVEYKTWKKNSPFLYDMILR
jgi:hypothetical protein